MVFKIRGYIKSKLDYFLLQKEETSRFSPLRARLYSSQLKIGKKSSTLYTTQQDINPQNNHHQNDTKRYGKPPILQFYDFRILHGKDLFYGVEFGYQKHDR